MNLNLKFNKNRELKYDNLFSKEKNNSEKKILFSSMIKYFKLPKRAFENIFTTTKNSKNKSLVKSKIIENFFVNPKFAKKIRDEYSLSDQDLKNIKKPNDESSLFDDKNSFKVILFNDSIHFITEEKVI